MTSRIHELLRRIGGIVPWMRTQEIQYERAKGLRGNTPFISD